MSKKTKNAQKILDKREVNKNAILGGKRTLNKNGMHYRVLLAISGRLIYSIPPYEATFDKPARTKQHEDRRRRVYDRLVEEMTGNYFGEPYLTNEKGLKLTPAGTNAINAIEKKEKAEAKARAEKRKKEKDSQEEAEIADYRWRDLPAS